MPEEQHKEVKITKNTDPHAFEWKAPEYVYIEKSNDWYWSIGIITLAIAVASFYTKNFFFGVIAIVGGFSLALFGSRKPNTITFKITSDGVIADKKIFYFEDLTKFHIDEVVSGNPRLFLEAKKGISLHLILPIDEVDIPHIKSILKKHLKEEKISEPWPSIISRLLGI